VTGGVEAVPDGRDLTVHHAARTHHVGARIGLCHGKFHVARVGDVVVHAAADVEHPAVAVIGELVQTRVSHQHRVRPKIGREVPQCHVQDAVFGHPGRSGRVLVLVLRHAEQHQPADAGRDGLGGRLAQGIPGVLVDPRHRVDGPRFVDAVGDEHRQHQMPWLQRRLGDEATHRRRRP
jgi:hypothetical protein